MASHGQNDVWGHQLQIPVSAGTPLFLPGGRGGDCSGDAWKEMQNLLLPPGVSTGSGPGETRLGGGGRAAGDQPPTTGAKSFLSAPCRSPSEVVGGDPGADTGPCCWHPTLASPVVLRQPPHAQGCPGVTSTPSTRTPRSHGSQVSHPWEVRLPSPH